VTVSLQAEAMIDDSVIYLDQIAKLSGGPITLRQRLARLDVAEFKLDAERTAVSSDQVRFRLLLAGIGAAQFQFSGVKRTIVVGSDEPVSTRKILAVADQAVRARYPNIGAPRDINTPLLQLAQGDRLQLEAKTPAAMPRTGIAKVDVVILVNGKPRESVPVTFELNSPSQSKINPFNTTNPGSLRTDSTKDKSDVLIKTRDIVRLVAVIGSAQIVASGEAQQDGKLGEIIRVRNVESNRTVSGRVESAGVVTVEY
jgi:hypothetical protein